MKNETKYKIENKVNSWTGYRLVDAGMMSIDHRRYNHIDPQGIDLHRMEITLEIKTARYGTCLEKDAIIVQGIDNEGHSQKYLFWKKNGEYFVSYRWNSYHTFCPVFFGYICGNVMKDAIITAADNNAKLEKTKNKTFTQADRGTNVLDDFYILDERGISNMLRYSSFTNKAFVPFTTKGEPTFSQIEIEKATWGKGKDKNAIIVPAGDKAFRIYKAPNRGTLVYAITPAEEKSYLGRLYVYSLNTTEEIINSLVEAANKNTK